MRKTIIAIACLSVMLLFAGLAQAQDVKLGVFHFSVLMSKSTAGKAAKQKLTQKANELQSNAQAAQDKLKAMQPELKKMEEEIENKGMGWSPETRQDKIMKYREKGAEYQNKAADLNRMYMEMQQQISKLEAELVQPIMDVTLEVVMKYGEDNGYTAIFEGKNGGVVYMPLENDITEEILPLFEKAWNNR